MRAPVLTAAARLAWGSGRRLVLLYLACTLLVALLPIAAAWQTKAVVDALAQVASVHMGTLVRLALVLAVLGIAAGLLPNVANFLSSELSRRIGIRAMDRLYGAINRLPGLARFESPSYLDRLELARQAGDTGPSQLFQVCVGLAQSTVTSAGFLVALGVLNPALAGVVLVAAVPGLLAQLALGRRRTRLAAWSSSVGRRQGWLASLLVEARAAKELRLYGIGGHIQERVLAEQRKLNAAHRGLEAYELRVHSGLLLLGAMVSGAGLIWAVLQVRAGELTIGDIFIMLAALASLQASLGAITAHIGEGRHAVLLFEHYLAVVADRPDLVIAAKPAAVPGLRQGIVFKDIWFRYGESLPWILRGVSLTIPAGTTCALVGVNGSGKSTLVKLLCRFYDPQRGSITWDGVDLRDMAPERLRERIGALGQDFMNYELSAHENIALGDVSAEAGVPEAARLGGADGFIARLPKGYATLLTRFLVHDDDGDTAGDSESGVQLSGGQWQRLALARTLLRTKADLLLLDEPSSSLDAEAEYEIHRRLAAFRAGRTSVLISHRLNCVRDADHIIVLDNGTVAEEGDHDALMAQDGAYSRLFRRQASGYLSGSVA